MSDIKRFPVSYRQRLQNQHGKGYVHCEITDRWLQFSDRIDEPTGLMFVDVMTLDANGNEKKLCELCLPADEIIAAVEYAKSRS